MLGKGNNRGLLDSIYDARDALYSLYSASLNFLELSNRQYRLLLSGENLQGVLQFLEFWQQHLYCFMKLKDAVNEYISDAESLLSYKPDRIHASMQNFYPKQTQCYNKKSSWKFRYSIADGILSEGDVFTIDDVNLITRSIIAKSFANLLPSKRLAIEENLIFNIEYIKSLERSNELFSSIKDHIFGSSYGRIQILLDVQDAKEGFLQFYYNDNRHIFDRVFRAANSNDYSDAARSHVKDLVDGYLYAPVMQYIIDVYKNAPITTQEELNNKRLLLKDLGFEVPSHTLGFESNTKKIIEKINSDNDGLAKLDEVKANIEALKVYGYNAALSIEVNYVSYHMPFVFRSVGALPAQLFGEEYSFFWNYESGEPTQLNKMATSFIVLGTGVWASYANNQYVSVSSSAFFVLSTWAGNIFTNALGSAVMGAVFVGPKMAMVNGAFSLAAGAVGHFSSTAGALILSANDVINIYNFKGYSNLVVAMEGLDLYYHLTDLKHNIDYLRDSAADYFTEKLHDTACLLFSCDDYSV